MNAPAERNFNQNIHGLRGLAALFVFLFHIYDMSRIAGLIGEAGFAVKWAIVSLSAGVDLFFMISGYLITASVIRHGNAQKFLIDRSWRIFPVFLSLHIPLFILAPFIGYKWLAGVDAGTWIAHFLSNLFLLPGVFDFPLLQLNAWSLSYEFLFYLVSATVYVIWGRGKFAHIALALLIGGLIALYPRAAFFAVGTAVYLLLDRPPEKRLTLPHGLDAVGFALLMLVMGYTLSSGTGGRGPAEGIGVAHLAWLGILPGFAFFYALVAGQSSLNGLLRHKATQFMGTISYSFYLWHAVVTFPLKKILVSAPVVALHLPPLALVAVFGVVGLALSLLCAWGSYALIEQRATRWMKARARHIC